MKATVRAGAAWVPAPSLLDELRALLKSLGALSRLQALEVGLRGAVAGGSRRAPGLRQAAKPALRAIAGSLDAAEDLLQDRVALQETAEGLGVLGRRDRLVLVDVAEGE